MAVGGADSRTGGGGFRPSVVTPAGGFIGIFEVRSGPL